MKRLLLTVVLMTVLVSVWQMLNPSTPREPTQAPEAPAAVAKAEDEAKAAAPAEEIDEAAVAEATPSDVPVERHVVEADVAAAATAQGSAQREGVKGGYRAILTSEGAQLAGFELTGYVDPNAKADEQGKLPNIELAGAEHEGARLLALRSRGGDVKLDDDARYQVVKAGAREAEYTRMLPSGVRVTRRYSFEEKRFAFTHELVLENTSSEKKRAELDLVLVGAERQGERDGGGMFAAGADQLAAACRAGDEREHFLSHDLEKKEAPRGPVTYAALDRHFFLAALVPTGEGKTAGCSIAPYEGDGVEKASGLEITVEQEAVEIPAGGKVTFTHLAYFGPKQLDLLSDMGHSLEENIDFGWFGLLSRPMLWILVKLYEVFGNFGIAVILLTLLMKILTFPLTQKSYVSMQQMKTLQPELKKLQQKYASDRATLGQKQMELYKERGINPMAGCFPVLVQMPIWFALYRTLWNSVELYQQPFFSWITDLSQPDVSPLFGWPLLPLVVGALMLGQTLMSPPPEDQPQMKYVMWGMPIMFTFFMLQMPSGLSIYMITNSVLTMAQQAYIKRKYK